MTIDTYEDNDVEIDSNLDFEAGIAGFEIAYGSTNRKAIGKAVKNRYRIRKKLDSINEKRTLDRQLNSFSHYWDM